MTMWCRLKEKEGVWKRKSLSRVRLFETPWTAAYQSSPSMGFSRKEYWSGVPGPLLGDLPDSGMEPASPALQADSILLSHQGNPVNFHRPLKCFFVSKEKKFDQKSSHGRFSTVFSSYNSREGMPLRAGGESRINCPIQFHLQSMLSWAIFFHF